MAISTQVNNDLYKRALSDADKKLLAQIAKTQGAGAASSAYLQAMNQAQSAIAAKTAGATTPSAASTAAPAAPKTSGAFSETEIPAKTPTPEAEQKDYLLFGKQDPNFKVGMTDEDKASWNAIGQKYAAGDTSWNRDTNSFREDGNWSGYYDDAGNYNGWLMAVNGIGGYAPAFGGKVGETGYTPGTVFYAPDGVAYTMGADGSLTKSGNVTLAQYGSYVGPKAGYQDSDFWALEDGQYKRYTNQTAPDSVLEAQGYYRDANGLVMPIDDQYRMAQAVKSGEITPEQMAMAQAMKNAVPQNVTPSVNTSGSTSRSSTTRETTPTTLTPTVTPQQTQPAAQQQITPVTSQATNNQNIYQQYMDQWDYPAAPEWDGTEYQAKRDAALEAAGEKWQGSEYQPLRDAALQRAEEMQWNYDPNTDPVWQAYQKQYRREGDRATKEALAQASMRTGGLANSYAVTAASQAGDYYAAQLSDRLPQLYQDAYQRYLQEFQRQLGISDQYQGFDDREYSRWADQQGRNFDLADRYNQYGGTEYQRYLDQLGQYNTDRNFSYGRYRDVVGDYRYADETAYDRQRDAIEDQRYDQQWAQQLREYADAQGWKQAEWNQYLREYGDQLSERERQWAYQMARDAVSDAQYADQQAWNRSTYADEREYEREQDAIDNQYRNDVWNQSLREYDDEQEREAWNYLRTNGIVTGKYAQILGVPDGTTYEQYYSRYLGGGSSGGAFEDSEIANPDYTGSGGGTYSGSGYSGGGSGSGNGYSGGGSGSGSSSGSGQTGSGAGESASGNGTGFTMDSIANRHGNDWVYIEGHGRFSMQELLSLYQRGMVKATVGADGKITFTWNQEMQNAESIRDTMNLVKSFSNYGG